MKKLIWMLILIGFLVFPNISLASFDVSLKYGSRGEAVSDLQDFLSDQGFYTGKIDSKFGFATLRAVKAFQLVNALGVDGYFGIASRMKANTIVADLLSASDITEQAEIGGVGIPSTVPGCASLVGYSVTTGQKCDGIFTSSVVTDPTTQAKLDVFSSQLQVQQEALNKIAQNTTPYPTSYQTPALTPEPLVFMQTPKLIFKNVGDEQKPNWALSYMTWETNRPSKLILAPILPDDDGWGGGLTWESCGRGSVSKQINSTCKIKVTDDFGLTAEIDIQVFTDYIDL